MSYDAAYQNMSYQQLRPFCTRLAIITLIFIFLDMANIDVYLNSSKKQFGKEIFQKGLIHPIFNPIPSYISSLFQLAWGTLKSSLIDLIFVGIYSSKVQGLHSDNGTTKGCTT